MTGTFTYLLEGKVIGPLMTCVPPSYFNGVSLNSLCLFEQVLKIRTYKNLLSWDLWHIFLRKWETAIISKIIHSCWFKEVQISNILCSW